MKKLFIASLVLTTIAFYSCEKESVYSGSSSIHDNADVDVPVASFEVYQLDSTKVLTYTKPRIDSVSAILASGFFTPLPEEVSTKVYNKRVVVKYTGSAANSRIIYTGDTLHMYVSDPSKPPVGAVSSQSGVNYTGNIYYYDYLKKGTYTISVLSTNVGDKGRNIVRSVATKTIIIE